MAEISCPTGNSESPWSVYELVLKGEASHAWWSTPVRISLSHLSGHKIDVNGFWDGDGCWRIRFTFPLSGQWSWRTESADSGMDGHTGSVTISEVSEKHIDENPNYRGHIQISDTGRYFEYSDGSPLFLLADTLWAGNSARCGIGGDKDGPFFDYLSDRKRKGFTCVLMQYMRGFGDTTNENAGQRNEGGYPFENADCEQLNPAYFQSLDRRMDALWEDGWVVATPVTWWGKMRNCFFTIEWAERITTYLMRRYGAYNLIWSLSGEYQYAFRDCGWTEQDFDRLGEALQTHNAFRHPVSIHPSGGSQWDPPHNVQSSRPFHNKKWLDHHWLQTGQSIDRMYKVASRSLENYALNPVKPVFLSEAYYERPKAIDSDGAYHSRWQAWCAFLNGSAGYGYGGFGMWQFYDPEEPTGETGKQVKGVVPWREAIEFPGSSEAAHVRALKEREWWRLIPRREWLLLDGKANPMATESDLTPPQCAAISKELYVVYIPRSNQDRTITLTELGGGDYQGEWISPRDGSKRLISDSPNGCDVWELPDRPDDSNEDWVCVLRVVGIVEGGGGNR